jgi:hypothetical protein
VIGALRAPSPRAELLLVRAGWLAWGAFIVIVVALALFEDGRSLIGFYADASLEFWQGVVDPDDYVHGFYYLPASQILFTPFALAGPQVGGALWRLLGFAIVTLAARRWAEVLVPKRTRLAWAGILVLIIPAGAGVFRNGQFDAPMWGLLLLAAASLARARLWEAAAALALAFALKPTAIVAVALMGAVWPMLGVRLAALLVVVLAGPFVFADPAFVAEQYRHMAGGIAGAVQTPGRFIDLAAVLEHYGIDVPFVVMMAVRTAAALATLALALAARTRLGPPQAAFMAFALAAFYLLLFNPRQEGVGYVGLALVCAPLAVRAWHAEREQGLGLALMAACVGMGATGLTPLTLRLLSPWAKPLLAIVVATTVVVPRALAARRWAAASRDYGPPRGT